MPSLSYIKGLHIQNTRDFRVILSFVSTTRLFSFPFLFVFFFFSFSQLAFSQLALSICLSIFNLSSFRLLFQYIYTLSPELYRETSPTCDVSIRSDSPLFSFSRSHTSKKLLVDTTSDVLADKIRGCWPRGTSVNIPNAIARSDDFARMFFAGPQADEAHDGLKDAFRDRFRVLLPLVACSSGSNEDVR